MEKLQGPINPCQLITEEMELGSWLDEFISNTTTTTTKFEESSSYNTTTEEGGSCCYNNYGEESPSHHYTLASLEDKIPFLQMLQSVESSQLLHHPHHHHQQQQQPTTTTTTTFPFMQFEPNLQFLVRLQHQKLACISTPNDNILGHTNNHRIISNTANDVMMKSEGRNINIIADEIIMPHHKCNYYTSTSRSKTNHHNNNNIISTNNNNNNSNNNNNNNNNNSDENGGGKNKRALLYSSSKQEQVMNGGGSSSVKEKRKRKRTTTRVVKNKEEVETQRMTHIAVERNRRRQMNEHLNALRSLMPPSYAQRGDQASIIGGAIDFVKELEQMLQSLQAQKKMRQSEENVDVSGTTSTTTTTTTTTASSSSNMFMDSSFPFHEMRNPIPSQEEGNGKGKGNGSILEGNNGVRKSGSNEEYSAEKKSELADIEVVVIQNHVNLKIQCQRRPGQLLKAIVAFEELRLTVLHLNITSLHTLVHYSFNLKIEDDCKLGSADDVARAVHQIFSFINLN